MGKSTHQLWRWVFAALRSRGSFGLSWTFHCGCSRCQRCRRRACWPAVRSSSVVLTVRAMAMTFAAKRLNCRCYGSLFRFDRTRNCHGTTPHNSPRWSIHERHDTAQRQQHVTRKRLQ